MTFAFLAFHHPRPEHFEEFVERTHRVAAALRTAQGCLSTEVWATADGDAVVTMGRFDSEDAYHSAFRTLSGLGDVVSFDDRERKPRQILSLHAR